MCAVTRHAEFFPFGDVGFGNVLVFLGVCVVAETCCDAAHGFDTDYAFEGQICLELQRSGKVVCGDLEMSVITTYKAI